MAQVEDCLYKGGGVMEGTVWSVVRMFGSSPVKCFSIYKRKITYISFKAVKLQKQ